MRKLFQYLTVLVLVVYSTEAASAAESAPAKNAASESEKKEAEKKPAQKKKAKTTSSTKTTKPQRLKGEITAIDAKAGTVSVKGTSVEKTFTTQDAAKDALEIVTVGEHVRVTYSEKDGKLVATSMKRMKPKSARSGTKEKKPSKRPPPAEDGGEPTKL